MNYVDSVSLFNQMNGRLRISITTNCQLNCTFCHREGINEQTYPLDMNLDFFKNLIESFKDLNGKEINLTGGEPLLHSKIVEMIDIAHNPNWKLAICTNGLMLDKIYHVINKLDEIKLSLHEIDDIKGKKLLGANFDFLDLEKKIKTALEMGANIKINFTLTQKNKHSLKKIIRKIIEWKTDFLICDLMETKRGDIKNQIGYINTNISEKELLNYSKFHSYIDNNTGVRLKMFSASNGKKWMIKNYNEKKLYTKMCKKCRYIDICGEGIFVLRVDPEGVFRPCLLRSDLEKKISIYSSKNEVKNHIIHMLNMMFN